MEQAGPRFGTNCFSKPPPRTTHSSSSRRSSCSTADEAVEFFDASKDKWRECAKAKDITVENGPWVPDDVQNASERMITLKAKVSGTLEGICQHALGVVSNLIVECFSCDVADNDNAEVMAAQILEDAADQ